MPTEVLPWKSSALPWHIEYMFQAMFYMVLGYVFREQFEGCLVEHNTARDRIAVWLIYLIVVYVPYFTGIEMPLLINILYDYMAALLGITAVVMVSKTIKSNRYVNYVGQNTLICFALHGKLYSVIQTILKRFVGGTYAAILGNTIASSVFALVFSLLLSVLLIIPAYIINRWFPFIVGRARK